MGLRDRDRPFFEMTISLSKLDGSNIERCWISIMVCLI